MRWVVIFFGLSVMGHCFGWGLIETLAKKPGMRAKLETRVPASDNKWAVRILAFFVGMGLLIWGAA